MSEFPRLLSFWKQLESGPAALATVVRTSGSTYRRPGARMLVAGDGRPLGLVSGGCLERDVAARAAAVLRGGEPALVRYDTRALLGCNGVIEILIEALARGAGDDFFSVAEECLLRRRQALVTSTVFQASGGAPVRLGSYPLVAEDGARFPAAPVLPEEFQGESAAAFSSTAPLLRSYAWAGGEAEALLHALRPPVRLWVLGGGPDVAPLAALGLQLGWQITVAAHPAQDAPELPPGCTLLTAAAEELPALLLPDARTVAVIMTHHYGRDLAYLAQLLPMPLPYLGLLGPRNRRERLFADLADCGLAFDPVQLAHFHSPAGLDLGADGPAEIAFSILGEIQAVLHGRAGGFLKNRPGGIHGAPLAPLPRSISRAA